MTLEASFWIWRRHSLAQVALSALHSNEEVSPLCPMSHLHKAPSITVLGTLQGNHLVCGSVSHGRQTGQRPCLTVTWCLKTHGMQPELKKTALDWKMTTWLQRGGMLFLPTQDWLFQIYQLTVSNLSIILKMLKRWAISQVKSLSQVVSILLI